MKKGEEYLRSTVGDIDVGMILIHSPNEQHDVQGSKRRTILCGVVENGHRSHQRGRFEPGTKSELFQRCPGHLSQYDVVGWCLRWKDDFGCFSENY